MEGTRLAQMEVERQKFVNKLLRIHSGHIKRVTRTETRVWPVKSWERWGRLYRCVVGI